MQHRSPITLRELLVAIYRAWEWNALAAWGLTRPTYIGTGACPAKVYYGVPWVRWGAICLGDRIYFLAPTVSASALAHEYAHVRQYQRYGFWTYLLLWWLHTRRVGYSANPFEREASRAEAETWARGPLQAYGVGVYWAPPYGDRPPATSPVSAPDK